MRNIIYAFALVLSGAAFARADEQTPRISDFAMQRPIAIAEGLPLQSFELPIDVYQTVVSPTLNDMRIFNSAGSVVPFEIKVPESTFESSLVSSGVPFFPIQGARTDSSSSGNTEVTVSQDDNGKIVSVILGDAETSGVAPSAYLVDLREFRHRAETLDFQWESSAQMLPLTIEKSSDLKSWSTFASGVLANLDYLGHTVMHNTIECHSAAGTYLRISAPENIPFTLKQVSISHRKTDTISPLPQTTRVNVTETFPAENTFLYDTGGRLPVQAINPGFTSQNILARINISSRATPEQPWISRLNTTAFRINVNGENLVSGFFNLPGVVTDRYWRVTSQDQEALIPSAPTLDFRWQPQNVLFLAQGDAPFLLAYGSALFRNISYRTNAVTSLAQSLRVSPGAARPGEPRQAGGPALLIPPVPEKVLPWKRWILWGVLAVILFFVLVMSVRLIKELKQTSE